MITVEFVLGVIFITVAITALIFCTTMAFASDNGYWLWGWLFCILLIFGAGMVCEVPRESNVLDGKAHYVEVYHTYDNDTIKTYHLNWNKRPSEGGSHR